MPKTCPNIGCGETFKHNTQYYRHLKNVCKKPKPTLPAKKYRKTANGTFECLVCKRSYPYLKSVLRHVAESRDCSQEKVKPVHECDICGARFPYTSYLKRHKESHANEVLVPSFVAFDEVNNRILISTFRNTNKYFHILIGRESLLAPAYGFYKFTGTLF